MQDKQHIVKPGNAQPKSAFFRLKFINLFSRKKNSTIFTQNIYRTIGRVSHKKLSLNELGFSVRVGFSRDHFMRRNSAKVHIVFEIAQLVTWEL